MLAAVDSVLGEIGAGELPIELVLNKVDALDPLRRRRLVEPLPRTRCRSRRARARASTSCASAWPSASASASSAVRLLIPYDEGARLAELYALGTPVDERADRPEGVFVRARLPRREVRRFAPFLIADAEARSSA